MEVKLKKLSEQVMVITGASSGIGLVTARRAAERGARLVVAARSEDALRRLVEEIKGKGGEAVYVVADVGREGDVRRVAEKALERFGGFDTWVNNAGVSIYGRLSETPVEDMRRMFDTNFWGTVYGGFHLRRTGAGRAGPRARRRTLRRFGRTRRARRRGEARSRVEPLHEGLASSAADGRDARRRGVCRRRVAARATRGRRRAE